MENQLIRLRPQRQPAVQMPHRGVALAMQPMRHLLAAVATAAHQHHGGSAGAKPQRVVAWQFAHRGADGGTVAVAQATACLLLGHFTQVHQLGCRVGVQKSVQFMPMQGAGGQCGGVCRA